MHRWIIAASIGLCLATGALSVLVARPLERAAFAGTAGNTLLLLAVAGLVLGPLLRRAVRRQFDVFEPITLFAAMVLLGYVVPAIMVMRSSDPVWDDWGHRSTGDQAVLLRGALLVTVYAVAGFAVGYHGPVGAWLAHRLPLAPAAWSAPALRSVTTLYVGLGFASLGALVVLLGGFGVLFGNLNNRVQLLTGLNYFLLGGQFIVVAMWLLYANRLRTPGRHPLLDASPVVLLALAVTMASGSKFQVLGVLMVVVIMGHYLVRRVSFARALVLALLGIGLFVGYNLYFREYLIRGYVVLSIHNENDNALEAIWWRFSRDTFIQVQTLMLLVDYFPKDHAFLRGETFASILTAPIPRSLFPGKPESPAGVVSTLVFPDLYARGTSIPPSLVGEAYINFGGFGVFAVMAIFGAFYRTAYAYLRRAPTRPGVVLVYAIVLTLLIHYVRGESFAPTILLLIQLVPTIVALALIRPPRKRGRHEMTPASFRSAMSVPTTSASSGVATVSASKDRSVVTLDAV